VKGAVIDASVAIKWFIPEIHSPAAAKLLTGKRSLYAPDLIYAEVGNTLWKKWKRGELKPEEALAVLEDFKRFPLISTPCENLAGTSWAMAEKTAITFYDALYVALAFLENSPLITADNKLRRSLINNPFGIQVIWIEDIQ
jgi:predicted nucleic acid-binding protein